MAIRTSSIFNKQSVAGLQVPDSNTPWKILRWGLFLTRNWPPVPLNECLWLFEGNTEFQTVSPLAWRLFEGQKKRCAVKSDEPEGSVCKKRRTSDRWLVVFFPACLGSGAFKGNSNKWALFFYFQYLTINSIIDRFCNYISRKAAQVWPETQSPCG